MLAAAVELVFSSSLQQLHRSASPAAAGKSRRARAGSSIRRCSLAASSERLLSSDLDLQKSIMAVQKTLHGHRKSRRETMVVVDNLKRLCIDHYFQEEIESSMDACMDFVHSDDLRDATLSFRLMREAGHDVSADDVLRRFTNNAGEFSLALSKDIVGLLSLHDMSHLDIGEEASLHKAKEFSTKHLVSAITSLEPGLASYLQSLPSRNTAAMEELATAEFQLNKQLHQKEMSEIERWWMDLRLAQEIPVARDQVLKWYTWSMTILQGSSFSRYRVVVTKIIAIGYVVDDIFDLVGTLEELSIFTDAIKK